MALKERFENAHAPFVQFYFEHYGRHLRWDMLEKFGAPFQEPINPRFVEIMQRGRTGSFDDEENIFLRDGTCITGGDINEYASSMHSYLVLHTLKETEEYFLGQFNIQDIQAKFAEDKAQGNIGPETFWSRCVKAFPQYTMFILADFNFPDMAKNEECYAYMLAVTMGMFEDHGVSCDLDNPLPTMQGPSIEEIVNCMWPDIFDELHKAVLVLREKFGIDEGYKPTLN